MPCRNDDPIPEIDMKSIKREKEQEENINNLTRMLCAVMTFMTTNNITLALPAKERSLLEQWWPKHLEWDKKRLAAAKERGLAKLSDEEKEALGY